MPHDSRAVTKKRPSAGSNDGGIQFVPPDLIRDRLSCPPRSARVLGSSIGRPSGRISFAHVVSMNGLPLISLPVARSST